VNVKSSKWIGGLEKTRRAIARRVAAFSEIKADDGTLERLEEALISADVSVPVAEELVSELRGISVPNGVDTAKYIGGYLRDHVAVVLKNAETDSPVAPSEGPWVVLVVGVNGTGKTTTVGKLARHFKREGRSVLIGACDTFRAAAIDQLAIWAERSDADFVRGREGGDSAAVAFDSCKAAAARGRDVVLLDTAGRLHTRTNLMAELQKVARVCGKAVPGAPHEVWLVLDAVIGQNGVVQARAFTEALGVTGVVLAKLDGTSKGGVVIEIARTLGVPVRFVGLGEGADDIAPFDADEFARALFEENEYER
jgi:fused signal recognition particle receptor